MEILTLEDFRDPPMGEAPGGVMEFEDAVLLPGADCLYAPDGLPLLRTCLRRGPGAREFPLGLPQPARIGSFPCRVERAVFLPYAEFMKFGHFLTETAAYLGPLLEPVCERMNDEETVVVIGARSSGAAETVRRILGKPAGQVLSTAHLDQPVRVDRVLVPRPTMINRCAIAPRHFLGVRNVVDRMIGEAGAPHDDGTASPPTYLSRSKLSPELRRIHGEEELERRLEARGWRIVHPETLPLSRQLEILRRAPVVAGNTGSALHLLMYFGTAMKGRTVIGLGPLDGYLNPNFVYQFQLQQIAYRHISCLAPSEACAKQDRPECYRDLRLASEPAALIEAIDRAVATRR